jgi:hypothetical protein
VESLPIATSRSTIEALLKRSRRQGFVPLSTRFLQLRDSRSVAPGPLAGIVRHRDERALELYLITLAIASAPPWNVNEAAELWARVLDLGAAPSGSRTISKVWKRLVDRNLVSRERSGRRASITLLCEDGSGTPYVRPGSKGQNQPYLKIPFQYWLDERAWYRTLTLPETAVLLIALSLGDDFILPQEHAARWYGLSPDTIERGLRGLRNHGLLSSRVVRKAAPLAPVGFTEHHYHTLKHPFGPRGYESAAVRNDSH